MGRRIIIVTLILSIVLALLAVSATLLSALVFSISYLNLLVFLFALPTSYYREKKKISENLSKSPKIDYLQQILDIFLLLVQIAIIAILLTYSLSVFSSRPFNLIVTASAAGLVGLFNFLAMGEYIVKVQFLLIEQKD